MVRKFEFSRWNIAKIQIYFFGAKIQICFFFAIKIAKITIFYLWLSWARKFKYYFLYVFAFSR